MTGHDRATILLKKAWDMALAPWKSLPMSCVMTYFSGSSIQIFSVMMTYSLFSGPLTILLSSPTKPFDVLRDQQGTASGEEKDRRREGGEGSKEGDTLWMQKLVFVVGQLACLVLGVVKLQYMGLLPTATSDWLAWETYTPVRLSRCHHGRSEGTNDDRMIHWYMSREHPHSHHTTNLHYMVASDPDFEETTVDVQWESLGVSRRRSWREWHDLHPRLVTR